MKYFRMHLIEYNVRPARRHGDYPRDVQTATRQSDCQRQSVDIFYFLYFPFLFSIFFVESLDIRHYMSVQRRFEPI